MMLYALNPTHPSMVQKAIPTNTKAKIVPVRLLPVTCTFLASSKLYDHSIACKTKVTFPSILDSCCRTYPSSCTHNLSERRPPVSSIVTIVVDSLI